MPGKIVAGAISGGTLSALHGFGEGQGDFNERLNDAKNSFPWGAAVGSVIPPLARAAGNDIASYLGSDAAAQPAENAGNIALGAGLASIPPPPTLLHLLTGALGGANPSLWGRQKNSGQ